MSVAEIAILRGYEVCLQVKKYSGGIVACDRSARTVEYKPLGGNDK